MHLERGVALQLQADTDDSNVIFKLLGFTMAMVAAPISMYFLTVNSIFSGQFDSQATCINSHSNTGHRKLNICRGNSSSDS